MDTIFLHGLKLEARIGIYRRERGTTQPVEIDLDIAVPGQQVFRTGKVADTIDYGQVAARITRELAERRFGLVEEMAQAIADILLHEFGAPWVRISIAKLGILRDAKRVGVVIERARSGSTALRPHWEPPETGGSDAFANSDTSP